MARFWRVVLGAWVGAALSSSGAVLQCVLRNPLAEPYVLGISSGAGLAAALGIMMGLSVWGAFILPLSGFMGALISLLAVYTLACTAKRTSPHTLILAGVVWGAVCGSLLMFLVSQSSAEGLHAILWWFLGDLQVYDHQLVLQCALWAGAAFLCLMILARDLNVLMLGEEMSSHIGIRPERTRLLGLILAAVLTALAVAASGLIGFVGLVIPHSVRALVGPDHRRLIPAAALVGAAFLVLTDGLGRILFYPMEIPVGVLTSLIGGPFFLFLLRRKQKEVWNG